MKTIKAFGMAEYDGAAVGRLVRSALFAEWRQLVAAGYLTDDGLLAVRARLAGEDHEFEPGAPDREALFLAVSDAYARRRGIDPSLMPGVPLVPDFPPDEDA
jgi:hypothetical protein